ncbi:MAG TPA: MarR family transcriptional regulator [Solirubrobacteraceae bacterium]|nr:MarR family transcriptional regulator [Solirubrobacteraceae bacterium]
MQASISPDATISTEDGIGTPTAPSTQDRIGTPTSPPVQDRVGPPASPLAGDLYALVVYLHKNCNSDLFEAVGALDLTLTQIKLLHHLEEAAEPLTLKRAAELVRVSLPAASRLVDDLVRRGFVGRQEDAEDRRMKRLELTDHGRSAIRRLNAARLSGLEQFVGGLGPSERATLAAALKHLLLRSDVAACRPDPAPGR